MKIDLSIPTLGNKFFDLRDSLLGDAYNFSWERPLSQVKYLAIHHSASDDTQSPEDIANFHIERNGWGGIGYHFLIDKEGQVFYVGDISTARANVANMNEQVVGIGLIGNFTKGQVPTSNQLDSARKLCEFFITDFPNLPNVKSWEVVLGHKELPNQKTICPGDTWKAWKQNITVASKQFNILPDTKDTKDAILKSQVENLQTDIAYLQTQRISLQETLQEREQELNNLKSNPKKFDDTLTIVQGLINLYKLIFLPRKVETFG